jgi:uncharacterized protein YpiB (UPF0302 family)
VIPTLSDWELSGTMARQSMLEKFWFVSEVRTFTRVKMLALEKTTLCSHSPPVQFSSVPSRVDKW